MERVKCIGAMELSTKESGQLTGLMAKALFLMDSNSSKGHLEMGSSFRLNLQKISTEELANFTWVQPELKGE